MTGAANDTGEQPNLRFHHGGVSVPSLDDAVDWYRDMLRFELEARFAIPKANATAAMLVNGPLRIELFEVDGAAPLPPARRDPNLDIRTHGNKHLAFAIDDLEAFIDTMTAKGAEIALIVRETFGRACFLRDCAGNLIEFVEHRAAGKQPVPAPGENH